MPEGDVPHMSGDQFRALGRELVDWIADYWDRVEELPVLSRVAPGEVAAGIPASLPAGPADDAEWGRILADIDRVVVPGLTHWQHPSFFAYFPANVSGPAVLGELLSAGLGVQGMLWATSPACTEIETRVLDWLGEAIGLPEEFRSSSPSGGGVIQGTASDAALVATVAGRDRARRLRAAGRPRAEWTVYASTQAHSSVTKAAMIAGIADGPDDRAHVRLIGVDAAFAIRADELEAALTHDLRSGLSPCMVCATVGTTASTAVDSIAKTAHAIERARSAVADAPPIWLHVDAAHAGAACVCPEFRWMLDGVGLADSFAFNPHKWLLTNFDCNCFWTRDRHALTAALSITPEYLRNPASESGRVIDYRDWQVPLGRRFRALKLWFVLRHYGLEGLRSFVRQHIAWASMFESWVRADARFELVAPRTMDLVCFRLRAGDAQTRAVMERLNASGQLYLTHATLPTPEGPVVALRMAIGGTRTREQHVRAAWEQILGAAASVLAGPGA
jgi:aromatic-L-amino-acid decarboxylase